MTDVLLFHHAQGLTEGVRSFADELRAAGHTVVIPDFYDGRTFATLDEGMAYAGEIGFDRILERNVRSADDLPSDLVYAGFSLGEMSAQKLAQTRPGARGALLLSGCLPVSEFGDAWPGGVPVQVHGFMSQGFAKSNENNFLTMKTSDGSGALTDGGANVSALFPFTH